MKNNVIKIMSKVCAFAFVLMLMMSCNDTTHFISDAQQRADVKADLETKMAEFPNGDYFNILNEEMPQNEKEALEFLYAYMFDGDLTDYSGEFYHNNVKAAFKAREEMPWEKTFLKENSTTS